MGYIFRLNISKQANIQLQPDCTNIRLQTPLRTGQARTCLITNQNAKYIDYELTGNTVKLVHTLFLYDIISFKPEVAACCNNCNHRPWAHTFCPLVQVEGGTAYQTFVQVYEQLADAAEAFLDYTTTLPFRRSSAQRLQEMLNRLDRLDVLEQKGALSEHDRTWKNARNRGETVVSLRAALGHIGQ